MKRWLMDLLLCPATDCRSKLQLDVYSSHDEEVGEENFEEIDEALITCLGCGRWYPVIDGITCMLPDDERMTGRQRKEETAFLERWSGRVPSEILDRGVPFGRKSET